MKSQKVKFYCKRLKQTSQPHKKPTENIIEEIVDKLSCELQ